MLHGIHTLGSRIDFGSFVVPSAAKRLMTSFALNPRIIKGAFEPAEPWSK